MVSGVLELADAPAAEVELVRRGIDRCGHRLGLATAAARTSRRPRPTRGSSRRRSARSCLSLVVVTSLVVVRRKLPYEWWYAIHFTAYAGVALAWFHMIPDGNDLVLQQVAADYWRSLYALALALILYFRCLRPVVRALRHTMRVAEVTPEGRWCRLGSHRRPPARPARGARRSVLLLAVPHSRLLVHTPPLLPLGGPRRRRLSHHGQEPRRPHREARPPPGRNTRHRRGAVRDIHRGPPGRGRARS